MSMDDVKGQEHIARFFRRVVENGRLAHAYIFAGPEGVGKAFFARELAKFLLCEEVSARGCGKCPSCLQADKDSHPDVTWISSPPSERELKREHVVEMRRRVSLKALTGEHKVFIINDAEKLNEESANLLLLTLEEPPAGSLFLLLTSGLERTLPTVRSRCQLLRFKPVSDEALRQLLVARGDVSLGEAARLSELSQGSPGRALAWLGSPMAPYRQELLGKLAQLKTVDVFSLAQEVAAFARRHAESRQQARWNVLHILELVLGFYRALWRNTMGVEAGKAKADAGLIENLSRRLGDENAQELVDQVLLARERIRANANIMLTLAELFSRLAQLQGN